MLLPAVHFSALLLACIFAKSFSAFKNDATEILYSHVVKPAPASPGSNSTLNQARNGGRHYAGTAPERGSEYPSVRPSVRPPARRPLSCGVLPGGEVPGVKDGAGGTLPAVPRGLLPALLLPPAVPGEGGDGKRPPARLALPQRAVGAALRRRTAKPPVSLPALWFCFLLERLPALHLQRE